MGQAARRQSNRIVCGDDEGRPTRQLAIDQVAVGATDAAYIDSATTSGSRAQVPSIVAMVCCPDPVTKKNTARIGGS